VTWLTPAALGDECCIKIPWRRGISHILLGAIREMAYKSNWEQFGAVTIDEVTQFVIGAMLVIGIEDNCSFEVRVDAATGKIQYRSGGGATWTDAPNSDGSSYSVVLGGDTVTNNYFTPPPFTATDKYCSAAWALARAWADDVQDFLELVDAVETLTAETLENLIDMLAAFFPPIGGLSATVEFLHEGALQVIIDYVRENAMDVEAISRAAEEMACAFIEAAKDNALEHAFDYIDWPNISPIFGIVEGNYQWVNFYDVMEFIYGVGTGESAWVAIVMYGAMMRFVTAGATSDNIPLTHWIAAAANSADLRAEEFCESCVECRSLIEGEVEYDFFNPRFWIIKGSHNSADNSIDCDANGELELWFSLVRDLEGITDASDIPRSCPFECVGTFNYEKLNTAGQASFLFSGVNIPSGSNTLYNFAGSIPDSGGWDAGSFSVSATTDRAAIRVRFTIDAGDTMRLRNLTFNIQEPTL
jgi:hypothetical protein